MYKEQHYQKYPTQGIFGSAINIFHRFLVGGNKNALNLIIIFRSFYKLQPN